MSINTYNPIRLLIREPVPAVIVTHALLIGLLTIVLTFLSESIAEQRPYLAMTLLITGFVLLGYFQWNVGNKQPVFRLYRGSVRDWVVLGLSVLNAILITLILLWLQSIYVLLFVPTTVFFLIPYFIAKGLNEADRRPALIAPYVEIEETDSAGRIGIFIRSDKYIRFEFRDGSGQENFSKDYLAYSIDHTKTFDLELVMVFKAFLRYYNRKDRGNLEPIDFEAPYRWNFYVKRWFGFQKSYLLPQRELKENGLRLRRRKQKISGVLHPIYEVKIFAERTLINNPKTSKDEPNQ